MKPGQTIAHYTVVEMIGAGGMGQVFRATDTKLGRDVALKILPVEMSGDPERLARFDREARTLASLQHPHIASIYGFEKEGDTRFLVMELAEGEDLAERLERGPLPVDEALNLALQLASGLEAAHAQGIIHRDLKPANIMVGPGGQLKILDFGLARAYTGPMESSSDQPNSPTITAAMTAAGVILGTAAYMSPEQARGRQVDQRADMWAFGVILFELLTGRRLFHGDTVSDTLAAVLRAEPDWDSLPAATPAGTRRLLRRCLARDPDDRLRSAGDARLELLDREPAGTGQKAKGRSMLPVALAVVALAVLGTAWILRPQAPVEVPRQPTHLSFNLPDGLQVASRDKHPLGAPQPCLTISEDGRLVVVTVERDSTTWLFRRFLDESEGVVISGSRGGYCPRISPDGQWISFMDGNALMRVAATGERATKLIELPNSFGHDWVNNDEILITRAEGREMLLVDAERGTVNQYSSETRRKGYYWPRRIPGSDLVLFNSKSGVAKSEETDVDQVSLIDPATGLTTPISLGGTQPQYLPGGTLLVARDGQLKAARFDLQNPGAELRPVPVLEGLLIEGWIGQFAVSNNGTMAYVPGEWLFGTELVWDDGQGNQQSTGFPIIGHGDFELSPDGSMLAVTIGGRQNARCWVYDLERGSRRLLTPDSNGASPIWSPDGSRLAYSVFEDSVSTLRIRTLGSNAPAQIMTKIPSSWSAAYAWHETAGLFFNLGRDIYRIDPDNLSDPEPLVVSESSNWGPDVSPDGRWMAYTSDESGRYEIYVRAVGGERSWSLSLEGGEEPIFSADGKAIFFRNGNRFYRTPILEASADGRNFRAGKPEVMVEGPYSNVPGLSYDVGTDGRLLLLRSDGGTERPGHINVILDWNVEMEAKLAGDR
jgi:hypothetical protein